MSSLHALIYGFIQGISEFLPVSSSGHLALLPHFFDIKDPGVIFDLLMHLGTALAIIIYFTKEIMQLLREGLLILKNKSFKESIFFLHFCVATFMSVLLILVLKDFAATIGRSSFLIGLNLIIFGVIMYLSDKSSVDENKKMNNKSSFKSALIIGASQALAIFPGVSRSGITLTSARFMKLSRLEASRFSFLLSLPIILASIAYKLPAILVGEATYVSNANILIGMFSSFFFGIVTIHLFLKAISKLGLLPFAIYRSIIGILVIVLLS